MLKITVDNKNSFEVEQQDGQWLVNGSQVALDIKQLPSGIISILHNGRSYTAIIEHIDTKNKEMSIRVNGQVYPVAIKEPIDQLLSSMGLDMAATKKAEHVKAPMPGMILKVMVEVGQTINKGDGLLILEAMKMENIIKAGANATVKAIKVIERTAVEKGAVLIEME